MSGWLGRHQLRTGTLVREFREAPHPPPPMRPLRGEIDGPRYETLVVADVDLDSGCATVQPAFTPLHRAPQGVYALVWHHGEPLGALTFAGRPDDLLATLPERARQTLRRALLEHQVRDALAVQGNITPGSVPDLLDIPHPVPRRNSPLAVTVAVCTRDRPEQLRDCLRSIGQLQGEIADVLVIDNASKDERTRHVAAEFPFARYVREPRRGLDWARNRALLEATTPVVAFTDDDVIVHPYWVKGLVRAFDEEPAAVVVTGLVVPAELATPAQVFFERSGGFGRGYHRRYFAAAVAQGEVAAEHHAAIGAAGTGANMAVLRERALELGGFDTALDVGTPTGGGGDLEFYFRVVAAGHHVIYEPTAVVRHRHRRTMDELARQRRGDGTASYSLFVGASRHYGRTQRRAFLKFAGWWALRHHAIINIRSALQPSVWPPAISRADTRGAIDAVLGGYYRRAVAQAAKEAALYPNQPPTLPLVRVAAVPRRLTRPPLTLRVDLLRGQLPNGVPGPGSDEYPTEFAVEVLSLGTLESTLSLRTGGLHVSAARLRWELASHLTVRTETSRFRRRLKRLVMELLTSRRRRGIYPWPSRLTEDLTAEQQSLRRTDKRTRGSE